MTLGIHPVPPSAAESRCRRPLPSSRGPSQMMHPTSPRCHSLHLQHVYLNPAASRHFQTARCLPHTSLLYSASPVLTDDCIWLFQLPPAVLVPTALLCFKTVLEVPGGKERLYLQVQASPSPSCERCCWWLSQGWHPTRLLRKCWRTPRHQLPTPFLLLVLSVMDLSLSLEMPARLPGSPFRLPRAQRVALPPCVLLGAGSLACCSWRRCKQCPLFVPQLAGLEVV